MLRQNVENKFGVGTTHAKLVFGAKCRKMDAIWSCNFSIGNSPDALYQKPVSFKQDTIQAPETNNGNKGNVRIQKMFNWS